jgi:hypothetical protein
VRIAAAAPSGSPNCLPLLSMRDCRIGSNKRVVSGRFR